LEEIERQAGSKAICKLDGVAPTPKSSSPLEVEQYNIPNSVTLDGVISRIPDFMRSAAVKPKTTKELMVEDGLQGSGWIRGDLRSLSLFSAQPIPENF
jgi:hypothetical protein